MSAAAILDRLGRVKQTAAGRWIARCPAHEDVSPSLSIRELEDGRILLHDFGGCETADVLAAVGLEFRDLFRERLHGRGESRGYGPSSSRIPARDLLEIVAEEVTVIAIVGADFLAKKTILAEDWERLALAVGRVQQAGAALDV